MLKKVRVRIVTDRIELKGSLFETPTGQYLPLCNGEAEAEKEHMELVMEGRCRDDGERFSVTYKESTLTGMEGTTTSLSFLKKEPGLVTMTRTGAVRTALVFEEARRHLCVYETPLSPFEVSVHTKKVKNRLLTDGTLTLDYAVELRGANAEQTHMTFSLLPFYEKPQSTAQT